MKILKQANLIIIIALSIISGFIFFNFNQKEGNMEQQKKVIIEIIEFTDPACTWCWGSEPILRKLQYRYKEQIKILFVMGGLENIG